MRVSCVLGRPERAAGAAGSGYRRPAPSAPTGDGRPATATVGGEEPASGDGATAPGDGGAREAHGDSQPLRGGQQFAGVQRPGER